MTPEQTRRFEQMAEKNFKYPTTGIILLMRDAYNLALEDAVRSATITTEMIGGDPPNFEPIVNQESILKLKIE